MNKKKILVADDDPAICEGIEMILEDAGYEVRTTTDGRKVIDTYKYLPDLILLDIWMSGIDGRDICKQLKAVKQVKKIPILMISSKDTEQISKEAGADGFLPKPFEIDDLLTIVRRYTR